MDPGQKMFDYKSAHIEGTEPEYTAIVSCLNACMCNTLYLLWRLFSKYIMHCIMKERFYTLPG